MSRMTLREAARRTSRSVTTLRRYIRGGRLNAEKRMGRYGPEYFLSVEDLSEAGLQVESAERLSPPARRDPDRRQMLAERGLRDLVPMTLYQELQLKHEQLLVQYGMVRAGGLRMLELRAKLEQRDRQLEEARRAAQRAAGGRQLETERLRGELREAHLELEGRALEIAALKEKVRALEMLSRNAVTTETIEKQFSEVMDQSREVRRLSTRQGWRVLGAADSAPGHGPDSEPDH